MKIENYTIEQREKAVQYLEDFYQEAKPGDFGEQDEYIFGAVLYCIERAKFDKKEVLQ